MAIPPDDVFFASIGELTARLRAKEFSAVELTRAFCDRLERIGPRYNALALSLREQAIRKAKDADGELKRGRYRALQGIPYGVKDLLAVHGQPTTWGAKPYAGQVFDEDAQVVAKLDKAGAILIGKLAMVELAGGGGYRFPAASLTGPGLNPWDRTRWSGGSSSGSGIATAAGLVTFALGSETSGSILTPSAFCGVTGLRPTYGLVSRRGAMALIVDARQDRADVPVGGRLRAGPASDRGRRQPGPGVRRKRFLLRSAVRAQTAGDHRRVRTRGFRGMGRRLRASGSSRMRWAW